MDGVSTGAWLGAEVARLAPKDGKGSGATTSGRRGSAIGAGAFAGGALGAGRLGAGPLARGRANGNGSVSPLRPLAAAPASLDQLNGRAPKRGLLASKSGSAGRSGASLGKPSSPRSGDVRGGAVPTRLAVTPATGVRGGIGALVLLKSEWLSAETRGG